MKKYSLLSTTLLSIILLFSCNDSEQCDDPTLPHGAGFSCRLVNSTGTSVIALWGAPYNSELVTVTTENGETPTSYFLRDNGRIGFVIQGFPSEPIGEEQNRTFYIKLPDLQGNPCRDIDTLQFEYQLGVQDCPPIWFDYFRVFYNDSLYYTGEYESYLEFLKT